MILKIGVKNIWNNVKAAKHFDRNENEEHEVKMKVSRQNRSKMTLNVTVRDENEL